MPAATSGLRHLPIWLKLVLAVSIGINLIILGTVAGSWLRSERVRSVPFAALGLRAVIRELPEAERQVFYDRADDLRPKLTPLLKSIRQDRRNLAGLLKSEPFDAEALRALFLNQRETHSKAASLTSEAIIEALAALDPDARQRIAQEITKPRGRRRR